MQETAQMKKFQLSFVWIRRIYTRSKKHAISCANILSRNGNTKKSPREWNWQIVLVPERGLSPCRCDARNFPAVFPKVPAQENCCDCGVFLLQYAAWFFDAYIYAHPMPITRKSVAEKFEGFMSEKMFRYSVAHAARAKRTIENTKNTL
jgi:hypothetical protein